MEKPEFKIDQDTMKDLRLWIETDRFMQKIFDDYADECVEEINMLLTIREKQDADVP